MTDILAKVKQAAMQMDGNGKHAADIGPVIVDAGAIHQVAPFIKDRSFGRVVVAADTNTYAAAGGSLTESLAAAGINVSVTIILPDSQGDVIADETALIQLILDLKSYSADVVVALGSGTLHDITRFAAYSLGIPFVSVPTAPSVDGFNSKGAPLILRGEKKTITAIGPAAIFADLHILKKAPAPLVGAGFGDMIGKYTSLFDWSFGSIAGGEPYSDVAAEMTRNALHRCVDHADEIAARSQEGVRLLTEALLESGFAMLLFGQSHPASGAEHHVSHYWEMECLRLGRRQLLHGAKVGVACAEIAELYHRLADERLLPVSADHEVVAAEIRAIPDGESIRQLLRTVGGPATAEELGINDELLERSIREAHHVRPNRYTLLRAYQVARGAK
ncbi:sn-glycerol-1-phosphate dehydrogenase [Paenibacillus xerothermodurans]|uniref:Sn-glycerol-1-phosphate dehydrogenase n=1 Tax=Paenibacillus xerothermodurans TaxID=1977292 RepID=A0A2W1NYT7_PAEXE|nr:sn-glycerol-1-phosphate dehydrogenase [Paenibacillus xerothermodurans]PZE20008.1 sn-glycerol-1-phosphate dehydrogenase [Paenibacillus xerothermodurans]